MQTFLPYPNFYLSAKCLDNKRLGKQRIETWQILQALQGKTKGWVNHPATAMWRGHEQSLILYGVVISTEWRKRGFQDIMLDRFLKLLTNPNEQLPVWFGYQPFHLSHRSNLVRKDFNYYKPQFDFENTPINLPYLWCKPTDVLLWHTSQKDF